MGEIASVPDRITHATLQLINEHGLGGVTMTSIAKVAGISRQTLYNHYADVNTIVAGAIGRHNTEAIELLEGTLAVVAAPAAKIEHLVRHVAAVSSSHNHILAAPTLSRDARATLADYDAAFDDVLGDILRHGSDSGEFRSDLNIAVDVVIVRHALDAVSDLVANNPSAAAETVAAASTTILAALQRT